MVFGWAENFSASNDVINFYNNVYWFFKPHRKLIRKIYKTCILVKIINFTLQYLEVYQCIEDKAL